MKNSQTLTFQEAPFEKSKESFLGLVINEYVSIYRKGLEIKF